MALADKVDTGPYEIRWGPILAGAFVSLGIWMFLYALGAAIGGAANNALGTLGASAMLRGGVGAQNLNIPSGYSWAVAGSILFSLFAALLGSSVVPHEAARRTQIPIRRDAEA